MKGTLSAFLALALGFSLCPPTVSGQSLEDFDYEYLSFRGFSLEGGRIWPTRVDPTYSVGVRVDMGYLGPGLRIVPGITYWSSTMKRGEVTRLENRIKDLVYGPGSPAEAPDLGRIEWSDVALSLDGHFVWAIPFDLLSYVGLGVSGHIMNGKGSAISGTFVEDLLDRVAAGLNFHGGLEYPVSELFRVYGVGRYEIMEDLRYTELRIGGQIMVGPSAPGEGR
jgi:hypothetical protein